MPTRRLRKSPRLKEYDYVGSLAAHIICVTDFRAPFFERKEIGEIGVGALEETTKKLSAVIHAYCFMPDHSHILVQLGEGDSLEAFVKHFKQLAGYRAKQVTGCPLWQPSYCDHILRREEALPDVAAYIWQNPVAAGLVEMREMYLFSGPRAALENGRGDPARYVPPRSFPSLRRPPVQEARPSAEGASQQA